MIPHGLGKTFEVNERVRYIYDSKSPSPPNQGDLGTVVDVIMEAGRGTTYTIKWDTYPKPQTGYFAVVLESATE